MDFFEKACEEVNRNVDISEYQAYENAIEWYRGSDTATVTLCQKRLVNRVKKYAKEYPDLFQILAEKDGVVVAHIPTKCIKIQYVEPREMSEEEIQVMRDRLAKYRAKKTEENA